MILEDCVFLSKVRVLVMEKYTFIEFLWMIKGDFTSVGKLWTTGNRTYHRTYYVYCHYMVGIASLEI